VLYIAPILLQREKAWSLSGADEIEVRIGPIDGGVMRAKLGQENMNEPIHVNETSFERAVLKSPIPVLVDFWAAWCGPCKMIAPLLDEIAKESADRFRVVKVNIDDEPALQQRFNIRGVPTLLFFNDGQLRDQIVGVAPKKTILEKLEKLISSPAGA
jgi:thioredoxin 1